MIYRLRWKFVVPVKLIKLSTYKSVGLRYFSIKPTSVQYPTLQRGPYGRVTQAAINVFESIVGKDRIVTDTFELESYNTDWMKMYRGESKLMLKPKTTEEVSKILNYCSKENFAVCPQGGNTGLVGGSVPVFDEIILNMSLMTNIIHMDDLTGVLQCEAGCVLEVLEEYANKHDYIVPLDLGAKGSCQIGGNVATNAGGLRYLRYGSLHGSVLGLEVVLSSGEILDCMSTLRKDNTGYDLKQIFIGSEGTLGIITKVAIQCASKPNSVIVAFLGCSSYESVLKTYQTAKQFLSEVLSSFEMMDHEALEPVEKYMNTKIPIPHHPFYMLIEVSGSDGKHDEEKMSTFLERVMKDGIVDDGTIATSPSHVKELWKLREGTPVAHRKEGYVYKYDISVPLKNYYELIMVMRKRLNGRAIRCAGYGHIGDSNIHLNVVTTKENGDVTSLLEPFIFEWTSRHDGSISAEHGIGFKRRNAIQYTKDEISIQLALKLKEHLDPEMILNPYKMFP